MAHATVIIRYPDASAPARIEVRLNAAYGSAIEASGMLELALQCEVFVLVDETGHTWMWRPDQMVSVTTRD